MSQARRIVGVEAVPVVVSGAEDFRISEGRTRVHTSVIVRLVTDENGLEGAAEIVSAPPGKPEEIGEEIVAAVERYVAPALVGLAVHERTAAMTRVGQALKGRPWTKAGVNVALHDLHARALGVPVAELLGGRLTEEVPVIGPVIGMAEPDAMAKRAAEERAQGFHAVKIKVGETVEVDVDRVAAVRAALGGGVRLRVDANDHYAPADAVRLIRAIERYDVEHVEQPLPRHDLLGMAEVRGKVGVPLMTDDAVATPEEAATVIRLKAADRIKVKVTKHGLDGARLIIGMMEAAGIGCVLGHVFEMGLAAVAEGQLAACARNLIPPHEIGSLEPMGCRADVIAWNLRPRPGFLRLPDGPGLGVRPDWPAIKAGRLSEAA
jgi:L-alanine-DL-glutamate epimerase-like enolase superfamily enzyme